MSKHQCVQFGVCPRADSGECFEVNADFKCGRSPEDPDCQTKLEEVSGGGGSKGIALKVGIPVAVIALAGAGLFFVMSDSEGGAQAEPSENQATVDELLQEVWPWLKTM